MGIGMPAEPGHSARNQLVAKNPTLTSSQIEARLPSLHFTETQVISPESGCKTAPPHAVLVSFPPPASAFPIVSPYT